MSDSWKISLPCTRSEAEALAAATELFDGLDEPPVLNTLEPDETRPEEWLLEAHCAVEPDAATVAAVRALVAGDAAPRIERVPAEDWVTMSQAGLEPIVAGRFFVHTPAHADRAPPAGAVRFAIEAGRAFGTGHHYTTAGCLEALDRLRREGRRFRSVADVGTGTGLLAFAALALWPRARALATDMDPVATEVTVANAQANRIAMGGGRGELVAATADGLDHPLYDAFGPFDLIVANILAQPLIELAPAIGAAAMDGGTVLLAGLLDHQQAAVTAAYRRQGFRLADRVVRGDWPTLILRKRRLW